MRAEKVIRSLLVATPALNAVVESRIYPAPAPQATALPCVTYAHVSTVVLPTISASGAYSLVQSRIDVTAITKTYAQQKALIEAIRIALDYQRGVIAGVEVISVIRGSIGPDARDDDLQLYSQSIDFLVTLRES